MIRRGGALLVGASLFLAGCSGLPAADPKAVLASSLSGLSAGNYRYTAVMPEARIEGVMDFASRSAAWTTTYQFTGRQTIEMRQIGQDQYTRVRYDAVEAAEKKKELRETAAGTDDPEVKADAAAEIREIDTGDDRFRRLDLTRIPQRAATMGLAVSNPDRTGAVKLMPWVRDATRDGATIRGTLSIPQTLSGDDALFPVLPRIVDTLTFTAGTDEHGRLSRLDIELPATKYPAEPAGRWTLTVDGYGTTPAPERPAAVKETPESTYRDLGP